MNGALQESEVQDLEGYPLPSLLADLPSPGRHISWQAAVAWLVAAVTLAGTGVKHLEGWPVARGARVSCPRRKSSTATTPCTTAVSHSSGCTFAGTISGGAILTRNRAGCTGTLVPARAGLGGRGRGRGHRTRTRGPNSGAGGPGKEKEGTDTGPTRAVKLAKIPLHHKLQKVKKLGGREHTGVNCPGTASSANCTPRICIIPEPDFSFLDSARHSVFEDHSCPISKNSYSTGLNLFHPNT